MTSLMGQAEANLTLLADNPYPGRGIVQGRSADGANLLQFYWIMGRSENSRNRRFVSDGCRLRTEPIHPGKMELPELVIYSAMDEHEHHLIVTNGDHTDTVMEALAAGGDSRLALRTREREPDAPHFTPRIAGGIDTAAETAWLAILRADPFDSARTLRAFYEYEALPPGFGWCLTTYAGDGEPLPSFSGAPYPVPLQGAGGDLAERMWALLHPENRVALALKSAGKGRGPSKIRIINATRPGP